MRAAPTLPERPTLANGGRGQAHPAAVTLHTDPARMRIRSVITTAEPDRAGDVVVSTGLRNLDEFMLNPVVLWAHNRTNFPPIGTCEWVDVQPRRIVAETRFAEGVPFAEDLFRLYEQRVLRGWSIGFVPRKTVRTPRPNHPSAMRIEEWDLLEYSAVPIPENQGAVTVALEKGLVKDPNLRTWLARFPDDRGGRWVAVPDVLSRLIARPDVVHSE